MAGNKPSIKIESSIKELFTNKSNQFCASEVAKKVKIQHITASKHLKRLCKSGFLELVYRHANMKIYKLKGEQ